MTDQPTTQPATGPATTSGSATAAPAAATTGTKPTGTNPTRLLLRLTSPFIALLGVGILVVGVALLGEWAMRWAEALTMSWGPLVLGALVTLLGVALLAASGIASSTGPFVAGVLTVILGLIQPLSGGRGLVFDIAERLPGPRTVRMLLWITAPSVALPTGFLILALGVVALVNRRLGRREAA